jgi:hypothetical protein
MVKNDEPEVKAGDESMMTPSQQQEIANLKSTIHKLNDVVRQMTLEIERLKKFSAPNQLDQLNA